MTFLEWPTPTRTASSQLVKTVAASGTPEAISATSLRVRRAIIIGRSDEQTDNADIVRIGTSSVNGEQPLDIAPGAYGPTLENVDLSQWYVDAASNGDGVVVVYER